MPSLLHKGSLLFCLFHTSSILSFLIIPPPFFKFHTSCLICSTVSISQPRSSSVRRVLTYVYVFEMMVLLLLTLALQLLFGFTCTASHWDVVSEAESSFAFCSIWPWALRSFLLLFSQCNHSEQISLLYAWKLNACLAWLSAPHPGQSEPMNIFKISSQTKMWRPWTLNLIPAEAKYNVAFYQAFITLHGKNLFYFAVPEKRADYCLLKGRKQY